MIVELRMNNNFVEKDKPPYYGLKLGGYQQKTKPVFSLVDTTKSPLFRSVVSPTSKIMLDSIEAFTTESPLFQDKREIFLEKLKEKNSAHMLKFDELKIEPIIKDWLKKQAIVMFDFLLGGLIYGEVSSLSDYAQSQLKYAKALDAHGYSYHALSNIRSLVVSTTLLAIEEVMLYCENCVNFIDPFRGDAGIYLSTGAHKKETFSHLWEIIKILDEYKVSYDFNKKEYQPRREKIRSKIFAAGVEVRTKQEIQRDEFNGCLGDIGNCLGELVIAFVFMLFIALLVTMCTS